MPIDPEDPFAGRDVPPRKTPYQSPQKHPGKPPPDQNRLLRDFNEHGDPELGGGIQPRAKRPDYNSKAKKLFHMRGYLVERVDQHNAFSGQAKDLFGIMDMLAIKGGDPVCVGIQVTGPTGMLPHIRQYVTNPEKLGNLRAWLSPTRRLVIVSFEKVDNRWQPLEREVTEADIETVLAGGRLSRSGNG